MVNNANHWIGLEFFCDENDAFWNMQDKDLYALAKQEIEALGFGEQSHVLDYHIEREAKAYPAYFGDYDLFHHIKDYTDSIDNLYLIGRNGMHRYNNMDHSMLSAKKAVMHLFKEISSKEEIWNTNIEEEYHENK